MGTWCLVARKKFCWIWSRQSCDTSDGLGYKVTVARCGVTRRAVAMIVVAVLAVEHECSVCIPLSGNGVSLAALILVINMDN